MSNICMFDCCPSQTICKDWCHLHINLQCHLFHLKYNIDWCEDLMTFKIRMLLNSFLVVLQGVPCRPISMGQGQEIHARRLLAQSMSDGGWLLLQNCHLGLDFLDEGLETVTTTESIHDHFRFWVTTDVHPKFPINFLQSSIKFTNEPPQGREVENSY